MRRVRTAIVGCGKVGQIHAAALSRLPQSELVAHCDMCSERALSFANRYGGRPYTQSETMLREQAVEAVFVCTPPPLHAATAIKAAQAGTHVMLEKPMAASLRDCDAILDAASHCQVHLGVISQRRFFEPVRRMKAAIDAGKIGRPVLGILTMLNWRDEAYYRSDPWRGKWESEGGGVLMNQAPHQLDILRWLMGPMEEISGYWSNLNHPYIEVEDSAVAAIRFRDGALGSVVASVSQRPGLYTRVHIHGSSGASIGVETDSGSSFVAGMTEIGAPPLNDLWTIPGEEHLISAFEAQDRARFEKVRSTEYYHELQIGDFLDAILDGREPLVKGEDGRAVVEIIEAIYLSSREHRPVRLPLT